MRLSPQRLHAVSLSSPESIIIALICAAPPIASAALGGKEIGNVRSFIKTKKSFLGRTRSNSVPVATDKQHLTPKGQINHWCNTPETGGMSFVSKDASLSKFRLDSLQKVIHTWPSCKETLKWYNS